MAVSDQDKIDFVFKKLAYGVAKTASETAKFGSNETIASPLPVYADKIWAQSALIPASPPGATTSVIQRFAGADRIRMTNDVTSSPNITWLATTTYGNATTLTGDFIPPTFGTGYAAKVYIGDPNVGPAARIYPDTTGEEWIFDYVSGVLHFADSVPAAKTATIGSGTVTVATHGIYVEVFKYVGIKGVTAAGSTSKTSVVADIAERDSLVGLTAGDMVFVQDASGIGTDAGAGEYAIYLWTGSSFTLIATQDSARTDARTQAVSLTPASTGSILIGRVGNGSRVVSVAVNVETAFDGDFEVTVGDAGDNSRLMGADENSLQTIGHDLVPTTYQFPSGSETQVYAYVSGTATVGSATVVLTYA